MIGLNETLFWKEGACEWRRDLMHMGTSAPFTFKILKISKSHISMSPKIMALKYIGRYLQEECMQKSPIKK
jgi:hypothetical protein